MNRLRALTEQLEPTLRAVWPANERGQKRAYNLLREAYIKARYSREYKITSEDINWLIERASVLRDLIHKLCVERIAELEKQQSAVR